MVFRNVLALNQISEVEEATYTPLICYENFLWTKKQLAIFGGMVGKSSRQLYAQQGSGSILPKPLRLALKGHCAPMDVIHHSVICTQYTMTEVMNRIQVLLNLAGRSEHFCSQYNECVTAMMKPFGEIMCRVHIADLSDKAPATKGIEAFKFYRYNSY
jgi:hypothetical protein